MNSKQNFQEVSYERHTESYKEYSLDGKEANHSKTWFETDTVDAWRHQQMYKTIDPILKTEPEAKWLTVGDGRYGTDAKYILDKGCEALPTDISDVLLKAAKDVGYLADYKKENAESLTFKDSEFDYVFCKESYHHFPRPMIALYEMLRVARKGVVLIEPNDPCINNINSKFRAKFFRFLKDILKTLIKRNINMQGAFEEVGNYKYCISRREIEKVALGLNYKMVAFKGINDAYVKGVEFEKLSVNGPLQKQVKKSISTKNFLVKIGFTDYYLLTAIIFKQRPSKNLLHNLSINGFEIVKLLDNPYIPG
jgi:ubiquinone/menaquinone biosynthesis C-methylase UbiE